MAKFRIPTLRLKSAEKKKNMIRNIPKTPDGVRKPKMVRLKVNVTYRCDRSCPNCNRATALCPSDGSDDVSPEYLKDMLVGCRDMGVRFRSIWLTGGEPTMHPRFLEIVEVLDWYRKSYRRCQIRSYTYHRPQSHWMVEKAAAEFGLLVRDTQKASPQKQTFAAQMAPVDDPRIGPDAPYFKGCWNARKCGTCLDARGFWCCPIGAAVARAFRIPPTITRPEDYTDVNIMAQYGLVCRYCGYWSHNRPKDIGKFELSKSWRDAVEAWKPKRKGIITDPDTEALPRAVEGLGGPKTVT